jgi:hypothetical protein
MAGLLTLNTSSDQMIQTLIKEKVMAKNLLRLGAIRSIHHHSIDLYLAILQKVIYKDLPMEDLNLLHFVCTFFDLNVEVNSLCVTVVLH